MASQPLVSLDRASAPAAAHASPRCRISLCDWRDFDGDQARQVQWDALAQWAAEPNPFFESWFLLPSLRALDPSGTVGLLCFEADGQLAGLLPVRRERNYYGYPLPHLRGWVHANCFLGTPLIARGFETLFWREILAWCDGHAGLALFLHLPELTAQGPVSAALGKVAREQRRPAAVVDEQERAMLQSELPPERYLEESLTGKKRKELRRQHRRLAEEGALVFEQREDAADLTEWTEAFLALEQAGWKGAAGSAVGSHDSTRALFTAALQGAAARGRLQRLSLTLDGRPIAMLVNFLAAPGAFSYKTAFDETYSRFSPGVLLQRENLALLERADIEWTDSCAAADHPMIDHFWREKRAVSKISVGIGGKPRLALFRLLARYETGAPLKALP